jgi:hypothetical protein
MDDGGLLYFASSVTRDGPYLCRVIVGSFADEVDDGIVVSERVERMVIAHILCHVNPDDLCMYRVALCR